MRKRVFDVSFKLMAIDLFHARRSAKEVANVLVIDPGRLGRWRHKDGSPVRSSGGLTEEQKEIKRLQNELKEVQLKRDILKKSTSIFSRGDKRYSGS